MSNYPAKARNPETCEVERVMMLDDHFGRRKFGVRFSDGKVHPEEKITLVCWTCEQYPCECKGANSGGVDE